MSAKTSAPTEPVVDGDSIAPGHPPSDLQPIRGLLLFSSGVLFFACMDTTAKYLTAHQDVPVIVAVRYVVNCLLMVVFLSPSYGIRLVQTQRTGLVILRAGCLATASIFFGFALQRLPVAESTSIVFLAPIIVMLFGKFLLGERIGVLGIVAAIAGFAGVLLIARPGSALDPLGVALAMVTAMMTAAYQLLSRILASSERTMALLFYSAVVGAIIFGLAAPWFWSGRIPETLDLMLLLSLGVYSGVGHYLFTAAHRYAPASTLAPVGYMQVVYAGLLGWLVLGHVPAALSIAGMIVIICAGALVTLKPSLARRKRLKAFKAAE